MVETGASTSPIPPGKFRNVSVSFLKKMIQNEISLRISKIVFLKN